MVPSFRRSSRSYLVQVRGASTSPLAFWTLFWSGVFGTRSSQGGKRSSFSNWSSGYWSSALSSGLRRLIPRRFVVGVPVTSHLLSTLRRLATLLILVLSVPWT